MSLHCESLFHDRSARSLPIISYLSANNNERSRYVQIAPLFNEAAVFFIELIDVYAPRAETNEQYNQRVADDLPHCLPWRYDQRGQKTSDRQPCPLPDPVLLFQILLHITTPRFIYSRQSLLPDRSLISRCMISAALIAIIYHPSFSGNKK